MSWTEVAVAFGSCIVGGIAGSVFLLSMPSKDSGQSGRNSVDVQPGGQTGPITQTNVNQNISYHGETHVSFTWTTNRNVTHHHHHPPSNPGQDGEPWPYIVAGIIVALVAAVIYLRYQVVIVRSLTAATFFSLSFIIMALVTARAKRTRFGGKVQAQNVGVCILGAATFLDIWFLLHPPFFYESSDKFKSLLLFGRSHGLLQIINEYGSDRGLTFVLYQLIGALVCVMLLAFVCYVGAKSLAMTIQARRGSQGSGGWSRKVLERGPGPGATFGIVVVLAVIAFGLTSGGFYSLLPTGPGNLVPAVPTMGGTTGRLPVPSAVPSSASR